MYYFIVTYQATINGEHLLHGKIGRAAINGYMPNDTKQLIEKKYKAFFPNAETLSITIVDAKLVSNEIYRMFVVTAQQVMTNNFG